MRLLSIPVVKRLSHARDTRKISGSTQVSTSLQQEKVDKNLGKKFIVSMVGNTSRRRKTPNLKSCTYFVNVLSVILLVLASPAGHSCISPSVLLHNVVSVKSYYMGNDWISKSSTLAYSMTFLGRSRYIIFFYNYSVKKQVVSLFLLLLL